jgi:predicted PhzF superfamily epimerase YddE/YHI9
MERLFYCTECRRIFTPAEECEYCGAASIKELVKDSPVNVIGSKLKGKVIRVQQNSARVLCVDEKQTRTIREYEAAKIRKIL